jgi:hypothetical protein
MVFSHDTIAATAGAVASFKLAHAARLPGGTSLENDAPFNKVRLLNFGGGSAPILNKSVEPGNVR